MPKNHLYLIFLSISTGLIAGLLSSSFLYSLYWVTEIRTTNPHLIWGLPLFGLIFGMLIKRISHQINQGVPYILEELDNHEATVSPWMAPFIFLSSLGTHLFGGSAGREGVGVIMGASAAHTIPKFRSIYRDVRPYLIYCGIAAGFSSIFGTPISAIIFSFELHRFKDAKKISLLLSTVVSSFVAFYLSHLLGPAHQKYAVNFDFEYHVMFYIAIASITSGLGGQFFYWGLKGYTRLISHFIPHVEWKLFFGGLLVSTLVYFTNSFQYIGIGTEYILKSFSSPMETYDFAMKCLLTIMTISIGFKGGEVTPLFFIGATFSNSIAIIFDLRNYALSSSLGMVSIFGAVTATPLASGLMGIELFGLKAGICSLVCCYIARFLMGQRTVYRH
jgi:H+/Cl- antiporter ClcA